MAKPVKRSSSEWIDRLDGRTGIAQTMRDRYDAMTEELGGVDRLSYSRRSLVVRYLWVEYWMEGRETMLAERGWTDMSEWIEAMNAMHGILDRLGIESKEGRE